MSPALVQRGPSVEFNVYFRIFNIPKVFMMISIFDTAVLVVTLASLAASLILLWTLVSRKLGTVDVKLFDKSKMKYTDGDNT